MECSQIFHDYFTIYRIRVFWNVRQIKFMQTIFMFSVIALYIVHRRVVINMVVGVYYIVIIKFIDFATKICLLLYYITWGMYIVWSTVVQWPMRKKSRKPWVIKVDLWFMKTLMIIGMRLATDVILMLHFISNPVFLHITLRHYYQAKVIVIAEIYVTQYYDM